MLIAFLTLVVGVHLRPSLLQPRAAAGSSHRTRIILAQAAMDEAAAKARWLAKTAPAWTAGRVAPTSPPTVEYNAGAPTAELVPPGFCAFGEEWSAAPLLGRERIGHDTLLLTFGLPDAQRPLGLSTCACLLARGAPPSAGSDAVVRPYTPVSTNAMLGAFQLMVKAYPDGAMSQQLARLPIGATIDFKHISFNVKLQYPFGAKRIIMLVGGTGIAPMLQALHALLGSPADDTQTTLLYSSKTQADILAKGTLDAWQAAYPHKLRVLHTLSREPAGTGWLGRNGRIDEALLREQLPPPSDDVLVFVCGPPPMYDALCGPRTDKELTGLLAEMGYRAELVVKF